MTLIGIAALVVYVSAPEWLPNEVVKQLDFVAFGLVVFAALPWFVAYLEEFEIGGFKAKLRDIDERVENTIERVSETRELVEDIAISGSIAEENHNRLELSNPLSAPSQEDNSEEYELNALQTLSREYVSIRDLMRPGSERTAKMTGIFRQLESAARRVGTDQTDVPNWLSNEDAGRQLAAIAWLRSHPEKIKPTGLINTVYKSNQPFVQYWALRVLSQHVDQRGVSQILLLVTSDGLRNWKGSCVRAQTGISNCVASIKSWTLPPDRLYLCGKTSEPRRFDKSEVNSDSNLGVRLPRKSDFQYLR